MQQKVQALTPELGDKKISLCIIHSLVLSLTLSHYLSLSVSLHTRPQAPEESHGKELRKASG